MLDSLSDPQDGMETEASCTLGVRTFRKPRRLIKPVILCVALYPSLISLMVSVDVKHHVSFRVALKTGEDQCASHSPTSSLKIVK